jgi:hypothetical protein
MLSFIHSRRVAHDLMVLAVLAMEAFFAWRASLMYVFILTGRVNVLELEIIRWLVFLAVGVFGFALATHRHAGIEAIRAHQQTNWSSLWGLFIAVGIVVLHDVAATIYTVGNVDSFGAAAAVVGMCGLVFLPFLVGFMSHAIAEGIERENKAHAQQKIARWKQKAELRYWKKHYQQASFAPELSENAPAQEKPLAPEHAPISLEHLFGKDGTLTIRPTNGHLKQESEDAKNGMSSFRPEQS